MTASEIADLELARCRKRIDESIAEIRATGAIVQVIEDRGHEVSVRVAYGEAIGDWLQVDSLLPCVVIDGRQAA